MKNPSSRQHQISYLSQFNINVQHIKGTNNVVADCLSRTDIMSLDFDPLFSTEILEILKDLSYFKIPPIKKGNVYYDTSLPG